MQTEQFIFRSRMPASAEEVLSWHTRPGAFERLTPPWESVRVLERRGGIEDGGQVVLEMQAGPFRRRWVAQHCDYQPGRQFCDVQKEGPFARWEHRHRVTPDGRGSCFLEDNITYALPFGRLGQMLGGAFVRRQLQRLFHYRHRITAQDLRRQGSSMATQPMKILVTGSTGLIGSALVPFLTTGGHEVVRMVRSRSTTAEDLPSWDPETRQIDATHLEGLDAVVHLAAEGIAAHRWTADQKARIRDSRVQGTRLLCEALAGLRRPPRVLIAASAIGYYGGRGDVLLDEKSSVGTGFLAEVCRDWEAATERATAAGIRVVNLRLGLVLSPAGGVLAKMLTPFRLGLGGRIGDGRQFMSWIASDDAIGAIDHAIRTEDLRGSVNAVAPHAVTNRAFTQALGRVLGRPTPFPLPTFAARLAFGEMADELLLAGARVNPRKLLDTGYRFLFDDLEAALRHLLGREDSHPARCDAPGDPGAQMTFVGETSDSLHRLPRE